MQVPYARCRAFCHPARLPWGAFLVAKTKVWVAALSHTERAGLPLRLVCCWGVSGRCALGRRRRWRQHGTVSPGSLARLGGLAGACRPKHCYCSVAARERLSEAFRWRRSCLDRCCMRAQLVLSSRGPCGQEYRPRRRRGRGWTSIYALLSLATAYQRAWQSASCCEAGSGGVVRLQN